jgi:predicted nucleotidyltransferase
MNADRWPALNEPFATALREAVDFIRNELEPVGIVATGTIIRGAGHANSDLDLYVVHLAPYRRRVQRFFNSVPAEIFINPPSAVRAYFRDEDRNGRRLTAHMLATGIVVWSTDTVVDELQREARGWLAKETQMSDAERTAARYGIASRLEDALDVVGTDDVTGSMLLADAVTAMLEFSCKSTNGQIPRRKDLIARLTVAEPDVAGLATRFFRAATSVERADLALAIADLTIGARGFFPWDSGPGPAPRE